MNSKLVEFQLSEYSKKKLLFHRGKVSFIGTFLCCISLVIDHILIIILKVLKNIYTIFVHTHLKILSREF